MRPLFCFIAWIFLLFGSAMGQAKQSRIVDLSGNGVSNVEIFSTVTCRGELDRFIGGGQTIYSDNNGRFTWLEESLGGGKCLRDRYYYYSLKKDGFIFSRTYAVYVPKTFETRPQQDDRPDLIKGTNQPSFISLSAASFSYPVRPGGEMLLAGFGANLATQVEQTQQSPLPTVLANRRVLVIDQTGGRQYAKLILVSPNQINYVMPQGLAFGAAEVQVVDEDDNPIRIGVTEIGPGAPGVFTANANGRGVPAAVLTRVKPGNVQSAEPVFRFDAASSSYAPAPIDFGSEDEILALTLFGTGWRNLPTGDLIALAGAPDTLTAVICPVEYVGKQPTMDGIDQINIRLPHALRGLGQVNLEVIFQLPFLRTNLTTLQFK